MPLTPVPPELERRLQQTLDKITTGNYAQFDVTTTGTQVQVAQRLGGTWSVGGWAGLTWDGRKEAGLRVKGTW